jgi:sugar (pentulose or hexulose) kinase
MNSGVVVAAVDLGASGGRVIAARVTSSGVELREVSRFPNEPVVAGGTLYWDILRLHASVLAGLTSAAAGFELASAGIDSWGVDYGLLDADGVLIGNPVHYRDARTDGVTLPVKAAELYAATGIQHLPFNTIYQLAASAGTPALAAARTLLLIPDLLTYWLTGSLGAEVTNASTTGLLDARSRTWAHDIMEKTGIPPHIFPPLRHPGDIIGPMIPLEASVAASASELRDRPGVKALRAFRPGDTTARSVTGGGSGGLVSTPQIITASHDTASAVVAVPASGPHFAYISSGTWSLAGMELAAPVVSEASRRARFTNEAGIDGTTRYLRNVTGLWLLQECLRCWPDLSLDSLLVSAGRLPALRFVIDPDDPVFLPPGDMPARITSWLAARGLPAPSGPAGIVRCILDSLALAHRRAVISVQELSGGHADVVHIVGGGSRNELLCQLTADATGLPVIAGPAEATALGNALVQARALGAAPDSLSGMRALLRGSDAELRRYVPDGDGRKWAAAEQRCFPGG